MEKKKKTARKLRLEKENLRTLTQDALQHVGGGLAPAETQTCGLSCADSQCCTGTASMISWCWTCDCSKHC